MQICLVMFQLLFTVSQQEETKVLPLVKQEREDCNLDLKVEVNIRAECGLSTGECGSVARLNQCFIDSSCGFSGFNTNKAEYEDKLEDS